MSRWDPLRDLRPGDVAVGLQRHSVLGLTEGKERPLVVYRPWFEAGTHAGWNVFGLTATPRFASGCQRLQVRYPRPAGLKKETWLYSARPYPVPPGRLFHRVGKLTWRDIDAIAAAAGDPEWPDLVRRARAEKVLT